MLLAGIFPLDLRLTPKWLELERERAAASSAETPAARQQVDTLYDKIYIACT